MCVFGSLSEPDVGVHGGRVSGQTEESFPVGNKERDALLDRISLTRQSPVSLGIVANLFSSDVRMESDESARLIDVLILQHMRIETVQTAFLVSNRLFLLNTVEQNQRFRKKE